LAESGGKHYWWFALLDKPAVAPGVSALCLALALTLGVLAILAWQLSFWWASRPEGRVKGQSIR